MPETEVTHDEVRLEEALKVLWLKEEGWNEEELIPILKHKISETDFSDLEERGWAKRSNGEWKLTESGRHHAADVIRRMRLAEWLFTEILRGPEGHMEESACQMEHILTEEAATEICTLLGHPQTCPHGKPIPRGKCCAERRMIPTPLIVPLTHLPVSQRGKVVSMTVEGHRASRVLASFGLIPGTEVRIVRRRPALVLEIDGTTLAVDPEVAERIYVKPIRRNSSPNSS